MPAGIRATLSQAPHTPVEGLEKHGAYLPYSRASECSCEFQGLSVPDCRVYVLL